jgi:hypothetical protein
MRLSVPLLLKPHILASKDDPAHWRNAERQKETLDPPAPADSPPRKGR